MIVFLVILAFIFYLRNDSFFWHLGAFAISLILVVTIKDIKILEQIIPNPNARRIVIIISLSILPLSFAIGKSNAQRVLAGKSVKIISSKILKEYGTEVFKSKELLAGQDNLKFVGAAGDYFFFISLDNTNVYAVKYSDVHLLELKPYNNPIP